MRRGQRRRDQCSQPTVAKLSARLSSPKQNCPLPAKGKGRHSGGKYELMITSSAAAYYLHISYQLFLVAKMPFTRCMAAIDVFRTQRADANSRLAWIKEAAVTQYKILPSWAVSNFAGNYGIS